MNVYPYEALAGVYSSIYHVLIKAVGMWQCSLTPNWESWMTTHETLTCIELVGYVQLFPVFIGKLCFLVVIPDQGFELNCSSSARNINLVRPFRSLSQLEAQDRCIQVTIPLLRNQ